ncbi:hypothetical protein D1007_34341 [Hordeum vulgare]|nr:hypothetical protein D1007_34341 [Hordeum vulgare]
MTLRWSARLSQSCLLLDGRVPTIQEKASLRVAVRDLSPGNSSLPPPPAPSRSASRFSILGGESLSHLAEVATDSGIVFRGEKRPILEQISAICAKEKLEGALAEAPANAARGQPSSQATTDPGHRETRGGATPSLETVAGTSRVVPSPLREPRGRPPTRLNPTEHRLEVHGYSSRSTSLGPGVTAAPAARGCRGCPSKVIPVL